MIIQIVAKQKVFFLNFILNSFFTFINFLGVPEECLSFCKGNVPTCDLQSIFSYQPCLNKLDSIISCQVENLHATPQFDPDWQAPCDWE